MNRERKFGVVFTMGGVLTMPLFIGIPLLASGILLLARGECIRAERWIRVLFPLVIVGLAFTIALAIAFPVGGNEAETDIARSVLCVTPLVLAMLVSLAMAALTVARFPHLSLKHRVMGLGFGVLCVVGACVALLIAFPWQALGLAVASAAIWAGMGWRRRRRAHRSAAALNLAAAREVPEPPVPPPTPVAPVMTPPKRPRVRWPIFGIVAWVLPPLGLPVAWLLVSGANASDYPGFGLLGVAFAPVCIALCLSPIFAVVSLCRRERYPVLPWILLALYGIGVVLAVL